MMWHGMLALVFVLMAQCGRVGTEDSETLSTGRVVTIGEWDSSVIARLCVSSSLASSPFSFLFLFFCLSACPSLSPPSFPSSSSAASCSHYKSSSSLSIVITIFFSFSPSSFFFFFTLFFFSVFSS